MFIPEITKLITLKAFNMMPRFITSIKYYHEKIFILNKKEGMAVCSSKKFSNKRVNFSQVTPYPSPILPNYELTIPTSLP